MTGSRLQPDILKFGKAFGDELLGQTDLFNKSDAAKRQRAKLWQEGLLGYKLGQNMPVRVELRGLLFRVVLVVVILACLSRLFYLQVLKGREYRVLAEENRVFVKYSPAGRGLIKSADGEILGRNAPGYRAVLLGASILPEQEEKEIEYLSEILEMNKDEVREIFSQAKASPFSAVTLKNNVTHAQQIVINSRWSELPGVLVEESLVRDYPAGREFSAILGFVGKLSPEEFRDVKFYRYRVDDVVGRGGVEEQYESILKGSSNKKLVEVNALGEQVRVLKETPGQKGKDLVLSVRADLQRRAYELLEEGIETYAAAGGVIVVQETKTGRVVSLVTLPTYDNQLFAGGISTRGYEQLVNSKDRPLFNRAVSGSYPPGSVVKPALAAAALSEGVISENTRISDFPQIIRIGPWEFPDWTVAWGRGAHGLLDVREAIAVSCDTFFYKIGGGYQGTCGGLPTGCNVRGLGIDKIAEYYRLFGFGQKTGVDIPGEAAGLVPDPKWKQEVKKEPWFLGNTYHVSIGQGDLLASPLQVVNYISALANGGNLMTPQIAREAVAGEDGRMAFSPRLIRNVDLGGNILGVVREGMRLAVTEGIIYPLRGAKIDVAAKTGTAEFGTLNARGEYKTHAWVAGFFPYENPKYSFVVLLESGGKSNNAAEVARKLVDWMSEH
ncbi:penicillin-binding protein 2 [candidate division CPR3 bacterium 4484_211]|uniref:Penicillin-binding protein 2 n=1 Tax=candidate division CPR3 bacterium 4484_211 TaxID=1968527 RepID=A0A1W9NX11_UNCC3|nr:MAG: penicillin-binding protein 2 [candidate division CPR3 bacterium 4484_211]